MTINYHEIPNYTSSLFIFYILHWIEGQEEWQEKDQKQKEPSFSLIWIISFSKVAPLSHAKFTKM